MRSQTLELDALITLCYPAETRTVHSTAPKVIPVMDHKSSGSEQPSMHCFDERFSETNFLAEDPGTSTLPGLSSLDVGSGCLPYTTRNERP
ncbi:hypothetical protein RRG08_065644 [Elysia crispata]|uniref:Uncharacterized protein n=1 Tax=Elysia crispata TaxID=231223 RepID=A0AAE0YMV2_9GAST|nr:hypothetical protein RRG08_065644 [Elysia crispata]